jgi:SAM-dependent methyltransferase
MSQYGDIIYPSDDGNPYPEKLCRHLVDRFVSDSPAQELALLDIGCSHGTLLHAFLKARPFKCYGTDLRNENVAGIDFRKCNIEKEKLPFDTDFFDVIFTKSVIEHVYNTDNFLGEVMRVLRPGGLFICMTPDWKSQMHTFYNDYTHVKPFTRKGMQDAMLINGFEDVRCEYFYQLPFVWKYPFLRVIPRVIALVVPDFLKWKDGEERNTRDRKIIRFSKELMLLAIGRKKK